MAISAPGIGSGLDVNNIVSQLMALEQRPLRALQQQQQEVEAQISAFGKLKSAVSSFQSAMAELSSLSKFQVYSTASSNEAAYTATASETATAGSFNINVTSFAARHKLASGAFADADAVVGTGTLNISVGADAFSVAIDGTNNTLAGIRDAINNSADNTGVTATVLTDDLGTRLILTSDDTGTSNALEMTVTGDGDGNDSDNLGLSQFVYVAGVTENLTQKTAAADAKVEIDGFLVTSASNTVTGALQGVTLELKALGAGTLTISRNDAGIEESVKSFADAYNALIDEMDKMDNSGSMRGMRNLISRELNTAANIVGGSFSYLAQVGVSVDKYGEMQVDSSRLSTAINADFSGFASLFADATEGFAVRFENIAKEQAKGGGLLDTHQDGLKSRLTGLEKQQLQMEYRLELTEARLRREFAGLDTFMSKMQGTSSFLSQQLTGLMMMTR